MSNPVALIRRIRDKRESYKAIVLWCPGCEITDEDGHVHAGLHMLPINGNAKKRPTWKWNGDLVQVTLTPSILTKSNRGVIPFRCHSFLRQGRWEFLNDCTHPLKGRTVPMVPLPDWVIHEDEKLPRT